MIWWATSILYKCAIPDRRSGLLGFDSGLDKATHDSFSPDKPEPYFAEPFAKLQRALAKPRLMVLTHHHADHVAGVLCAPNFSELAAKTIITRQVADCMMNTPH